MHAQPRNLRVDGTCTRTNLRPRGPATGEQEYRKSMSRVSQEYHEVCVSTLVLLDSCPPKRQERNNAMGWTCREPGRPQRARATCSVV